MKMQKKTCFLSVLRTLFSPTLFCYMVEKAGMSLFEHAVWRLKIHAAKGVRIHPTASLRNPDNIYIGENSHINYNCCVWAGETSRIVIGRDVLMGPNVQLHASRHGMKADQPMMQQPLDYKDILIGDDVWLCGGVIVTAGTQIANGVIVAANAVVTHDIMEPYVIVAGIPAKVIGKRK